MLIINGGLPRSGTVLTGRIITEILRQNDCNCENINLDSVSRIGRFVKRAIHSGVADYKNIVLHTHSWADAEFNEALSLGNTKIFWNYRDPRDILVSLMKLHDLSFDGATRLVVKHIEEGMLMYHRRRFLLPYEVFNDAPSALVASIGQHLQLPLNLDQISGIVGKTSKENASQIMKGVANSNRKVNKLNNSSRTLQEDAHTFINDRHIQSGLVGRFREELTPSEIDTITEKVLPFLKRYGYPSI